MFEWRRRGFGLAFVECSPYGNLYSFPNPSFHARPSSPDYSRSGGIAVELSDNAH